MAINFKFDPFMIIVQSAIVLSVVALFVAIFIDFLHYSNNNKVQKEKKSIVETGTMTVFFVIFYAIIRSNIGGLIIESYNLRKALIIIGTLAVMAGCAINIKGRFDLGKNWANQIKIYSEHTLVKEGTYKIVRHPLYSSIMLMFYGACLVYNNVLAFLAVTFIFIPFMYYRAKQEEKMLIDIFDEYNNYKRKTGMFFPKLIRKGDLI